MTGWIHGDLVLNAVKIHYRRTGGDRKPLVLCHGVTDDGACWTRLAQALASDYDVIMPDGRGHGFSEARADKCGVEEQAADIVALIGALGLARPALGGHSIGGVTASYVAARYPDLVSAVFLEDPVFVLQDRSQADREASTERIRQWAAGLDAMTPEQLLAHCREQHPTWAPEDTAAWCESKRRVRLESVVPFLTLPTLGWREALGKTACPVLVLRPDAGKGYASPEWCDEAIKAAASVRVVHVPGSGHLIHCDQFDTYVRTVREFLGAGAARA